LVLRRARNIGLNLGLGKAQNTTKVDHTGFDVDGRRWHKIFGGSFGKAPAGLAGIFDQYDFYAQGGGVTSPDQISPTSLPDGPQAKGVRAGAGLTEVPSFAFPPVPYARGGASSDTVPAMLTPGEFVISRPAVETITRNFGGGFLDAVNQMRVAPGVVAA